MCPAPIVMADLGAPIYWRTDVPHAITIGGPMVSHILLADRTEEVKKMADQTVRCVSPIVKPYRKRKYFEEKTTAILKIKQTSIATVRNHILTVACFLTPLSFHYPLSLEVVGNEKNGGSGRSRMLRYDAGLWRLRFIYNLNMQFFSKRSYFLFHL
jgi:hypothetical protein